MALLALLPEALDQLLPCERDSLHDETRGVLAVSRDGSVVAFGSDDGAVIPGDTNGVCDVFARGEGL